MNHQTSLLDRLRLRTKVDCDTLDTTVPQLLGPFEDCTSNQAIALSELSKASNQPLIEDAARASHEFGSTYREVSTVQLTVEIAVIKLALRILPYINGHVHLQISPFEVYSTPRTIHCAERLCALARHFDPHFDSSRIVIKIPSTWEGLQACRDLERRGIKTLATTLFAFEQAVLAAEAGCHYVAPYLHDLRFITRGQNINEDGESTQSIDNCVYIQQYFQFYGYQTQVLPAALTTPDECMKLAGVQHITIAPALLQSLAEIRRSDTGSQFDYWEPQAFCKMVEQYRRNVGFSRSSDKVIPATEPPTLIGDQAAFRMALTRNDSGSSELKQIYAINEFCEAQIKLENLLMPHL